MSASCEVPRATWALAALAALAALVAHVDGDCIPAGDHCYCLPILEPLNKTMRRLEFSGRRTWQEIDRMCKEQNADGFEMLKRDFLVLSDADKALCQGQPIPLGLYQAEDKPVVWRESDYLQTYEWEVNGTHLASNLDAGPSNETTVGSLDAATGQWRLVANDTTFGCAICQRAWVAGVYALGVAAPAQPKALVLQLLHPDNNNNATLDDVRRRVLRVLNETQDIQVEVSGSSKVINHHGDRQAGLLRIQANDTEWIAYLSEILQAVQEASYAVGQVWASDECPRGQLEGITWSTTDAGKLGVAFLPKFRVASRRCSTIERPDGAVDGVWDNQVFHWLDHGGQCRAAQRK